ncbi:MAG: ThiF family adenylyltransferase [bacterium]|nr:ThiF family adenylyltransferase [bacterium]
MLGTDGQALLERTCIGIVGVGGTGSAVAEQLTRLGVGKIVLVDDDRLDESNLSRVYGSYPGQLPKHRGIKKATKLHPPKVEIVAQHLRNIDPRIQIESIFGNVAVTDDLIHLLGCDAIMLCTDEHWGRSVINQISYQYLIPVVNMGVRVDAPSGIIQGATGVVHAIGPDKPCLWCYQYLNAKRIAAESMPPEVREERIRENYVEGNGPAPMVISLTSTVSSLAVTELLHVLTDFRGERAIHALRYDILDMSFSRCTAARGTSCVCSKVESYGDLGPLPSIDDRGHVERCRLR